MTRKGQVMGDRCRRHMDILEPIYGRAGKMWKDKKQKHLKEFEDGEEVLELSTTHD